jgi:prolipoprotein diacylglyceryltransferase
MLAVPIANLASGFGYGAESKLPWAIELWGAGRHPVQVYEAFGAAFILWYLWPSRLPKEFISGSLFLQFTIVSTIARLFFEVFRGDSLITMYNLRIVQIIALIIAGLAFWAYYKLKQNEVA